MLVLLLFGWSLEAQKSLFVYSGILNDLTVDQSKIMDYASANGKDGNSYVVDFSTISDLANAETVTITTVGQPAMQISFRLRDANFEDPSHYSLSFANNGGEVTVYVTPEGVGGTIRHTFMNASLLPLGGNRAVLIENVNVIENNDCRFSELEVSSSEANCDGDCGPANLDLLILITPEARQWLNNTYGLLANWFIFTESHSINLALVNSDLPNKRVFVRTHDFTPDFAYSTYSGVFDRLIDDNFKFHNSPLVAQLRSKFRADIAIMLTNNSYGSIPGMIQPPPLGPVRTGIVQVEFFSPRRHTLVHEVSHHFGCRHQDEANGTCPFGMNMKNGFATIHGWTGEYNRILHFSNPTIGFAGSPTGEAGVRENAGTIRNSFCQVASISPSVGFKMDFGTVPPFGGFCVGEPIVMLETDSRQDCDHALSLFLLPTCPSYPYTYEWRWSNTPDFTTSFILGGNSPFLNTPLIQDMCPKFYLRCTVIGANGVSVSKTNLYWCHPLCFSTSDDRNTLEMGIRSQFVYPNPTSKAFTLNYANCKNADIEIYDVSGTSIPFKRILLSENSVEVELPEEIRGILFVKIKGGESAFFVKVLKL